MLLYLILAILLGVSAGTLTGLIPGIHINLISILLLSISALLLSFTSPLILVIFIVAMAITHTFIDYIPSILLGAPDEDSILSILPGHKLLLKGDGFKAIIYTLYGSATGTFLILLLTPLFIFLLPKTYSTLQPTIPYILIIVSLILIITEKNKKLWALLIFLLSGFLGIAVFNLNLKEPLLPLLTGLFGASSLLISINKKTIIPPQKIMPLNKIKLSEKSFALSSLGSLIASPFTAFLPGLGSSQAAIIGSLVIGENKIKEREFLFLLGCVNTIVMGLSFITFYTIGRTRTGASVAVSKLIPKLTLINLLFIILAILIASIISFFLTIYLARFFSTKITSYDYKKISIIVIITLIIIAIIFSGNLLLDRFLGLLVFIIATALGITAIQIGVKRTQLMGCLIIPTILIYLI